MKLSSTQDQDRLCRQVLRSGRSGKHPTTETWWKWPLRRSGSRWAGLCWGLWPPKDRLGSITLLDLSDGLGPCFVHGFRIRAFPCLIENLLHLFRVPRSKAWLAVVEAVEKFCPPKVVDGHDKRKVGGRFLVEAEGQSSEGVVPCRSCLPFCLADPGKAWGLHRYLIHLMRMSGAEMRNGVTIHWAVSNAHKMSGPPPRRRRRWTSLLKHPSGKESH